jgi:hypothetical protein
MIAIVTTSKKLKKEKRKKLHYVCVTSKNRWSKYGEFWGFLGNLGYVSVLSGVQSSSDRLESHPPPAPSKENPRRCDEIALGRHGSMHCSATVVGRKLRLAKYMHTREKLFCL